MRFLYRHTYYACTTGRKTDWSEYVCVLVIHFILGWDKLLYYLWYEYSFYKEQRIKHVTNKTQRIFKRIIFQAETLVLIYKLHTIQSYEDSNLRSIFRTVIVFWHFATGSYKSVPIGFATPGQFIYLTTKSNNSRTNEQTETKFGTGEFRQLTYVNATEFTK